ncbi:E3 ubiquitin-protein ligase PPP1R11-like [Ruditapes philippinarum]|uniref:E3 ubiquitin-protein ligase PPP1R11-like n=1 Tax=Ruditapes philippinarum TaxID=129788 RepID=UPI00295B3B4A|nr:E3 ubiquitin-protein ligase PPP1R11-like [Ruditapes philippinarum]
MMAEATTSSSSSTQVVEVERTTSPTLQLKLRKPKNDKKVKWSNETVDNEHLNKKKSKCCCIYEKPRMFGESSDEDDDCTGHCRGHKGKCYKGDGPADDGGASGGGSDQAGPSGL